MKRLYTGVALLGLLIGASCAPNLQKNSLETVSQKESTGIEVYVLSHPIYPHLTPIQMRQMQAEEIRRQTLEAYSRDKAEINVLTIRF